MSELARLALQAHVTAEQKAAARQMAAEQEQRDLRAEFVRWYMDLTVPQATAAVADLFNVPLNSPILAELHWLLSGRRRRHCGT